MNIVFVCTGNTCRSPMAEGIFRKKTNNFNVSVLSCGISAIAGDEATINAISAMKERNIDISAHRARQINQYIIDEADYIICLSASHYNALLPYAKDKLISLGNGIPDPFMGSKDEYLQCADMIEAEIDKLLASDFFLEISKMNEADIDCVSQIEKANFSVPWSKDAFLSQINKNYAVNYTIKYLDKPIGYICCDNIIGEVSINTVAIDSEFRLHGYGTMLINKIIDWCKNNESELLTLEVRESNKSAINLYKKCGFEIIGIRKNFYSKPNEDALIMTKYFNGDNK